jgi:para-aminobenzoate synthetase
MPDTLDTVLSYLETSRKNSNGPFVIAVDGRSGTGKSTLAEALRSRLAATIIDGDAFYAGGTVIRNENAARLVELCIDWRRQKDVLQTLRSGRPARFQAFDWDAFDGSLVADPVVVEPMPWIILEGVYSARPELSELLDVRILLRTSDDVRTARLLEREWTIGPWERQWHHAEAHYFEHMVPESGFDLVIDS